MVKKAYRCRIYPNKTQKASLQKIFGCTRFVFNQLLDVTMQLRQMNIQGQKKHPSKKDLINAIAHLKKMDDYAFLKEADSIALQASAEDLADAFDRWFKKQNQFPTFKKRSNKQSYTTKTTNHNIRFVSPTHLKIPKVGAIKIKDSFGLYDNHKGIRRITVTKEPTGHYYVSILLEETIQPLQKTNAMIGLDMGLTYFLAKSNGSFVATPAYFVRYEQQLQKAQRILSRRIEQAKQEKRSLQDSKNIQKARQKVSRIHAKIKHARRDFLHKLSKELVCQYDILAMERLNIKEMLQQPTFAKRIADASWSTFRQYVTYKANWYGKEVRLVDAAYTSQTCVACKKVDKASRNGAIFCCTHCGYKEQADSHAAKNILEKAMSYNHI